jgi:hypothetical protein
MALSTIGVSFKYGSDTPTKTLDIKSYPEGILAKRAALEVTSLKDDARVYISGVRETPDSLDFNMNYDAAVFAEINALTEAQKCELTFSDGSGFTFDAYLSANIGGGEVNAVIEMTVSAMPVSVPVFKSAN